MTADNITTADLLREYAAALRRDWGSIDGRSEKRALNWLADRIEEDETVPTEVGRKELDLCPAGGGHWTEHCWGRCAEEADDDR